LETVESQMDIWIKKNKDNKEKIQTLKQEIKELKESGKETVDNLNEELKKKKEENESIQKKLENVQKDSDNILASLLKLQEERVDFFKDSDQQQKKMFNTQQVMKDMSMKLKESLEEVNSKSSEIEALKQKLNDVEPLIEKGKNFDQLKQLHASEMNKTNNLSEENQQMKIELEDHKKTIKFLDEDNKKKNTKIKVHIDTINDINNKLTKILSEKDQVRRIN
jgi:chromosome segregation ATPase